jgi:hypothetical protein
MRTLLVFALLAAAPASGWEVKKDSTGTPVKWAREARFVVDAQLADRLGDPGAFGAVARAVEAINAASPGLRVRVEAGVTGGVGFDPSFGATNRSEIVAPEQWEFDASAIAVTVVTLNVKRHEIIDADIAFNATHRRFKVLPEQSRPGGSHDDIQNTLTHELGHAVGLAHSPGMPHAVMYPGARKGEVSKRALSEDDVAGLQYLYGQPEDAPTEALSAEELAYGCAATGGGPTGALVLVLAALLGCLSRRPRRGAARIRVTVGTAGTRGAVLALCAGASAAHATEAPPLERAAVVATGEVVSRRTLPLTQGEFMLTTELEVRVRECVKGDCPGTLRVRVPGGRAGDLEQIIAHQPVPKEGEVLAVAVISGRRNARLWRLDEPVALVSFARALADSGLSAGLTRPVSVPTPR